MEIGIKLQDKVAIRTGLRPGSDLRCVRQGNGAKTVTGRSLRVDGGYSASAPSLAGCIQD
jgi:hypothetical protein